MFFLFLLGLGILKTVYNTMAKKKGSTQKTQCTDPQYSGNYLKQVGWSKGSGVGKKKQLTVSISPKNKIKKIGSGLKKVRSVDQVVVCLFISSKEEKGCEVFLGGSTIGSLCCGLIDLFVFFLFFFFGLSNHFCPGPPRCKRNPEFGNLFKSHIPGHQVFWRIQGFPPSQQAFVATQFFPTCGININDIHTQVPSQVLNYRRRV